MMTLGLIVLGLCVCFIIYADANTREVLRLTTDYRKLAAEFAAFRVNTRANVCRTDEMLQELRDEVQPMLETRKYEQTLAELTKN